MENLLDSKQALKALGLWSPKTGRKPNQRYLNYLVKRNILPRLQISPRKFMYEQSEILNVLKLVKTRGLSLTSKP